MDLRNYEDFASTYAKTMRDCFDDGTSPKRAAEQLAMITLADITSLTTRLCQLWNVIFTFAREAPEQHDKLATTLIHLSRLPDAKDDKGESLVVHKMIVWKDLPMLGWEFREELDVRMKPSMSIATIVERHTNLHGFMARLMATKEPVFSYSWFALVALRTGLETRGGRSRNLGSDGSESWVRAAAAWIKIMGREIFWWDEEYESGPKLGARGRGGLLWDGKHGFCTERWALWRSRFEELATMDDRYSIETRAAATEAGILMGEIESSRSMY